MSGVFSLDNSFRSETTNSVMKAFAVVGLLFLASLLSFCNGLKETQPLAIDGILPTSDYDNLKQLLQKIQLAGQISANTVGSKISGQLNTSLGSATFPVTVVNSSLTDTSLTSTRSLCFSLTLTLFLVS